jgi:hypothetical protein
MLYCAGLVLWGAGHSTWVEVSWILFLVECLLPQHYIWTAPHPYMTQQRKATDVGSSLVGGVLFSAWLPSEHDAFVWFHNHFCVRFSEVSQFSMRPLGRDCLSAGWLCDVEFMWRLVWFSTLWWEMSRESRWPSVSVFMVNCTLECDVVIVQDFLHPFWSMGPDYQCIINIAVVRVSLFIHSYTEDSFIEVLHEEICYHRWQWKICFKSVWSPFLRTVCWNRSMRKWGCFHVFIKFLTQKLNFYAIFDHNGRYKIFLQNAGILWWYHMVSEHRKL